MIVEGETRHRRNNLIRTQLFLANVITYETRKKMRDLETLFETLFSKNKVKKNQLLSYTIPISKFLLS